MFQFLIGRIGTTGHTGHSIMGKGFNSLQVESVRFFIYCFPSLLYGFNSLQVESVLSDYIYHICFRLWCFNSLQVESVPFSLSKYSFIIFSFQFLIGRIGTILSVKYLQPCLCFNSLQVESVHLEAFTPPTLAAVSIPYRQNRYILS